MCLDVLERSQLRRFGGRESLLAGNQFAIG